SATTSSCSETSRRRRRDSPASVSSAPSSHASEGVVDSRSARACCASVDGTSPPTRPFRGASQFIRKLGNEPHLLSASGVNEPQLGGVEKLPWHPTSELLRPGTGRSRKSPFPRGAVNRIADNGMAQVRQVDADLVGPPGLQARAHQIRGAPALQ